MKVFVTTLLLSCIAASLAGAAPKVRWPRDAVEWEKLKEAAATAEKEEKGYAFIFVPAEWPEDTDGAVGRSVSATNDAISALKSFCLIVKGETNPVVRALQGGENKEQLPKALLEGFTKAGNSYPMVVVRDTKMETVLGATSGTTIYQDGAKVFREAKKMFRELGEEKEEKDKDKDKEKDKK